MRHRARRDDAGYAELTLAFPLMLLLLGLVVQVALYAYASHTTQSIAHHGLAATRPLEATEAQGHAQAQAVAEQMSGELLHEVDIEVERTETTATIQVSATVGSLIPGTRWPVAHTVSAPVERAQP